MSKKLKVVIAIGGTGCHVLPGYHLAEHLTNENYDIHLIPELKIARKIKHVNICILIQFIRIFSGFDESSLRYLIQIVNI